MAQDKRKLSGPEKAALMLIAVGDDLAARILQELDDVEIQKLSSYMTSMTNIPNKVVDDVAEEFVDAGLPDTAFSRAG